MIDIRVNATMDAVSAYLSSQEFAGQWQASNVLKMSPSVRFRQSDAGLSLIFGASMIQKDSRRPRFILTPEGNSTRILQIQTTPALYIFLIIFGLVLCILPGILVLLQWAAMKRSQTRTAQEMINILQRHFS